MDVRKLTGMGEPQSAIRVRKSTRSMRQSTRCTAVVKTSRLPKFMSNIMIRDIGNQRSHWVVKGPQEAALSGTPVTTEMRENEVAVGD